MNATKHTAFLWPDHNIGKRESRRILEAHNALYNSHAELLAALQSYGGKSGGFCSCPLDNPAAPDEAHSTQCQQSRAAIAQGDELIRGPVPRRRKGK